MDQDIRIRHPYASRSVEVLAAVAEHGFDLHVDDTTIQRWDDVFQLMRSADDIADSEDPDKLTKLLRILETFETSYPSLEASALGAERYSVLVRNAAAILRLGNELQYAKSGEDYIALRRAEGLHVAEVVSALSEAFGQTSAKDAFDEAVAHFAVGAGFLDTMRDAGRDHEEAMLSFQPTVTFRIRLGVLALREFLPQRHALLKPAVLTSVAKLGMRAVRSTNRNKQLR